jgi:hypothetical protein
VLLTDSDLVDAEPQPRLAPRPELPTIVDHEPVSDRAGGSGAWGHSVNPVPPRPATGQGRRLLVALGGLLLVASVLLFASARPLARLPDGSQRNALQAGTSLHSEVPAAAARLELESAALSQASASHAALAATPKPARAASHAKPAAHSKGAKTSAPSKPHPKARARRQALVDGSVNL